MTSLQGERGGLSQPHADHVTVASTVVQASARPGPPARASAPPEEGEEVRAAADVIFWRVQGLGCGNFSFAFPP